MADIPSGPDDEALHAALRRLLAPLAKLAVHKGVLHATLDDWLRAALVDEAYRANPELAAHRRASRVSAATGLHRREVQRLLDTRAVASAPQPSLAAEVFAHWRSDPLYLQRGGQPKALVRVGAAPSFEALAHAVTRDVHPRTLLEELLRFKLATWDVERDVVTLAADGFVPRQDVRQMLGFLGNNVGDHLQAAVANVVDDTARHFEQAMFAEGLSEQSLAAYKVLATNQWRAMTEALVPALENLLEKDRAAGATAASHRVRLGLYSFNELVDTVADVAPSHATQPEAKARRSADKAVTKKIAAKPNAKAARIKRAAKQKGTS